MAGNVGTTVLLVFALSCVMLAACRDQGSASARGSTEAREDSDAGGRVGSGGGSASGNSSDRGGGVATGGDGAHITTGGASSSDELDAGRSASGSNSGDRIVSPGGTGSARELAAKLGRDHFLIGMGNDLASDHNYDGAYTLGVTLDIHYAYLVGLLGQGGWPDWNENGSFVDILAEPAIARGVIPMYTLYSMAAWGEANIAVLTNDDYMGPYWDGAKLLFSRLGELEGPSIVHFEPDFWAYAQHQAGEDPGSIPVHVTSLAADCAGLPDNLVGMGGCLVALARKYAPLSVVGFHASVWAAGDAGSVARFLKGIGAGDADFVALDMLDRDAGCFEAGNDPNCTRTEGGWYWDDTNQTSPNFHEHLAWAKELADELGKPILWWQVPFGVPSDTPGGTPGHYRDNRVKYIFEHIDEFIAAGGAGAVFGTGAGNQTYIDTDGDQFKAAASAYFEGPTPL